MPVRAYGATFKDGTPASVIELYAAFNREDGSGVPMSQAEDFLGHYEHLHRAIDLIWNKERQMFIWNEWTEMVLRAFIEEREVSLAGAGATWKTTSLAVFALCFWLADPFNTRVVITSTTLDGLRARIWKEVMKFWRPIAIGNQVNHPHPKVQTIRGDDGYGIFGIAVEAGDVDKAVENIQGRHAPRTLVEVDEMTGVSSAIVKAGANLEKGARVFKMLGSANPEDQFDQHGQFSEPEQGWAAVNQDTGKWRTKRGGVCIHLNGLKSPNVMAGKNVNPGMITPEDIEVSRRRDGENSPAFWKYVIGFWAPAGLSKKILTATILDKFKARSEATWVNQPTLLASLDPAFEGSDRRVLRFGKCGMMDEPQLEGGSKRSNALLFTGYLLLKVDVTSKEPIHYQLARQTREECKQRGIEPYYFGMDSTGEGGGTADIFKREWSQDFLETEFGGRASDRQVSDINPRKGYEEYYDRISELWYQFRHAVERNQIRGLDTETAYEFCQREYGMAGARVWVESKKKMKERIGRSPDLADAAAVMLEVALVRGLLPSATVFAPDMKTPHDSWLEFARKMTPLSRYAKA